MTNLNFIYSEIFLAISIMALLIIGVFKKNSSNLIYNLSIISLLGCLVLIFECMFIWSLLGLVLQFRPIKKLMFNWKSFIDRILSLALLMFSFHIIYKNIIKFRQLLF